jgi:DEAD/DEAH box helicase domain-containing protein
VAGYKKIRYYTHENVGFGDIQLPDQEMHTSAAWWTLNPSELESAFASRHHALDGFLGAAYTLHHIAVLRLMAEPGDLGRAVGDGDAEWFAVTGPRGRGQLRDSCAQQCDPDFAGRFQPTVFLYDNYPGGVGLSAPLFDQRYEVVRDARELIAKCPCSYGCPACVGPILSSERERGESPKDSALRVLELLSMSYS